MFFLIYSVICFCLKNKMKGRNISQVVLYVIGLHCISLVAMTLTRLVQLFYNVPGIINWKIALRALLKGVQFDNLIASYVGILPFVVMMVICILPKKDLFAKMINKVVRVTRYWYAIWMTIVVLFCIFDVRYYRFFDSHLDVSFIDWFRFVGETTGMLVQDSGNYYILALAILFAVVYNLSLDRYFKNFEFRWNLQDKTDAITIAVFILMLGISFVGLRGSIERYPLRVSMAYFSSISFYNKLGVNPFFNFVKSIGKSGKQLPTIFKMIDEKVALKSVQEELGVVEPDSAYPLTRQVDVAEGLGKCNVVLILMESMAADNFNLSYNGKTVIPFLSSLREKSLYFKNTYSGGVHTNNGIVSTMYGYGPNFKEKSTGNPVRKFVGLPGALHQNGYENYVFVTSNPNYDDMQSFFYENHIDKVYSLYDYPREKSVNNFGVQDDYMLSFGKKFFDARTSDKPFFAMFLTVSNHSPYVIPEPYMVRGSEDLHRILAYTDDALKDFVEASQKTEWGKNTVFVLVSDHGAPRPTAYDYNLAYNAIDWFVIHDSIPARVIEKPAIQQDVYPTVMGLLGLPYESNTIGMDLMKQSRRYAFFCNDDHLGCSDDVWLYDYNLSAEKEFLYRLPEEEDLSMKHSDILDSMRTYAFQHKMIDILAVEKKWSEGK